MKKIVYPRNLYWGGENNNNYYNSTNQPCNRSLINFSRRGRSLVLLSRN